MPDYGGPSGFGGNDSGRGGARGGRGGGRASAGMSTARGPQGQFGGGGKEAQSKQIAQAQLKAQTAKAKQDLAKAQAKARNQNIVQQALNFLIPGKQLNNLQNQSAQVMGKMMMDVLTTNENAEVVRDPTTGRITGVRDDFGRLTGRDLASERGNDDRGGGDDRRKRLLLAQTTPTPTEETPTLGKRVIRTDLAIETEAERVKGRRLGKRSLLSRATTLGA